MQSMPSADPPLRERAAVGQHASPLARLAVFLVGALIVYASLYPFTGWTDTGVPAFAYLTAPLPRYWLGGEVLANISDGYGPEVFAVDQPAAFPYRARVRAVTRGPTGLAAGTVQIIRHDGAGNVTVEDRPFVIQQDGATVELGTIER